MKPRLKKALKIILPLALGVFLIAYSYQMTSPDDRKEILKYIREADPLWVGISMLIGLLSHISRAIRWNYLLEPMGYRPKVRNNVFMVMMASLLRWKR